MNTFKLFYLFILGLLFSISANSAELHVGSGQPYSTVQAAVDAASSGDIIVIHQGTYREEVNINVNGLTIQPNGSDEVIMNGCEPLLSWTDEGDGVYSTTMDWDVTESLQCNQIFVDGVMMHEVRWPKQPVNNNLVSNPVFGVLEGIHTNDENTRNRDLVDDDIAGESDARWEGARIYINLSNPKHMKDGQGWTGVVYSKSGNEINVRTKGDTMGVKFTGDNNWGVDSATQYYLFRPTPSAVAASGGVTALLGNGEWWKNGNTLYVKTPDGSAPASTESSANLIEAKKYPYTFRPEGSIGSSNVLKNVTIKDLKLFATSITTDNDYNYYKYDNTKVPQTSTPIGKSLSSAENVIIDGIDAKYVYHTVDAFGDWQHMYNGRTGIILTGYNCVLRNSTISYSAASAISISGQQNKVLNNIISEANYMAGECGAINNGGKYWDSYDHEIGYNTIYNTPHAAISIRTLQNSDVNNKGVARLHHNHLFDALRWIYDAGYIDEAGELGNWVRVDHNILIHDNDPSLDINPLQFGIYIDFGDNDDNYNARYIIDHNVCAIFRHAPITVNHANETQVLNNTLYGKDWWADLNGLDKLNDNATAVNNQGLVTLSSDNGLLTKSNNYDVMGDGTRDDYFTDWRNGDWSLTANATDLIDQGTTTDWDDPISGSAPDIGAFEYGADVWEAGADSTSAITLIKNTPINTSRELICYPNPAQDVLNISATKNINEVTVTDLQGRARMSSKDTGIIQQINVSGLPKGIYIISCSTKNGTLNQVFLKK